MSARTIRGHDYRRGVDVEMTGAEWRALLSEAAYIRRVGNAVLAYQRENGQSHLVFEVYEDNGAVRRRRRE